METLPITVQTAYAELVEQLLAIDTERSIGQVPGAFVTKQIKGKTYLYFQFSAPGGTTKQVYVGPRGPELDALARRFEAERASVRRDREGIVALAAMLRAGGAAVTDAASARVLGALAESGVFRLGGLLVGTHAFVVLGNVLGVRWPTAARTEDIDIAARRVLEIAVPDLQADVPRVIESLGMGFLPVPAFSPKEPSTSFKVRGRGLRVDLVTPARQGSTKPVVVRRLNAAAAPVRFLEYLLDTSQPAAVVDGGGILVRVPSPAHFGVHKLLVAQDRPAAFQAKAAKDVAQAAQVLAALEELRPGDVAAAWRDAASRGAPWARALVRGRALLERRHPETFRVVERSLRAR
ncbi:MAG: hypothetical protein KF894_13020 [Labilithrix sp.]|nr:hypothetical protein [Labilithrix sp.]